MSIELCNDTLNQALTAFGLGALSAFLIFLLCTLLIASSSRSRATVGRPPLRCSPYLRSSHQVTDVKS